MPVPGWGRWAESYRNVKPRRACSVGEAGQVCFGPGLTFVAFPIKYFGVHLTHALCEVGRQLGFSLGERAQKRVRIHPGGEQKHRCSFSGNPSTSSKPAHTVQTRLKPDEMAKMKMPPPREIQELCTWAGKTGNKGEGWNLQVLRKGRKVEWEAELQPLCVNLVRFAVRTFQSFTFCFVLCFPWMTASSSSERSSFEYFGTKIDCQSEFCASPKNMCSFSRLHNWKFLEFFRRSKDVPKECFVLYTNSSTNFHFMRVKKCKILTTRIQYFIN